MLPRRGTKTKEDEMNWPMSRMVEGQARRMVDMMDRLGVDPVKLVRERGGQAYAEACTKCLECSRAQECLDWLDRNLANSEQPLFCSNLPLFEKCRKGE